jgi:hypothetical protein
MAPPLSDEAQTVTEEASQQPRVSPVSGVAPPVEHQFPPGQSGNPGGLSKKRRISNAMERLLDLSMDELASYQPKTVAEGLALAIIRNGSMDPRFTTHALERTEGKVADTIRHEGGPQPLQIILAEAKRPTDQPDAESNLRDPAQSGDQPS